MNPPVSGWHPKRFYNGFYSWQSLTQHTNDWWMPDFRVLGPGSEVSLTARAGGALLETGEDDASLEWYRVQMCRPGSSLHLMGGFLAGYQPPDQGGPTLSMLTLELSDTGDGAVLRVSDALLGCMSETRPTDLRQGWSIFFQEGYHAFVERS